MSKAYTVNQIISLPRDLRQRVVESASKNQRSISAEFRYAALRHLGEQERETKRASDDA